MKSKKKLIEEGKKAGLNMTEDAVKQIFPHFISFAKELVKKGKSKWLMFLSPLLMWGLDYAEKHGMKLIDKIDGEEG